MEPRRKLGLSIFSLSAWLLQDFPIEDIEDLNARIWAGLGEVLNQFARVCLHHRDNRGLLLGAFAF